MWSARSAPVLELRPSRRLLAALGGLHGLAAMGLMVAPLPMAPSLALGAALAASLTFNLYRFGAPASRWFLRRLECGADGVWRLRYGDGRRREAWLLGGYVHPQLLVLRFATGRFTRCAAVILPDTAEAEALRRLRVRVTTWRWAGDEDDP